MTAREVLDCIKEREATAEEKRAQARRNPDPIFNASMMLAIQGSQMDVARLVAAVEAVLGLHPKSCEINGSAGCEHGDECPVLVCAPCGESWPCPTVAAVEAALKEGE